MKLFVDIDTGEIRRSLTGPVLNGLVFTLRDLLPISITYTQEGVAVTSTVLASSAVQKLTLRTKTAPNTMLALVDTYSLSGEIANVVFSLNTQELVDYFAANVSPDQRDDDAIFEIEVSSADNTRRQTLHQSRQYIRREMNQEGDELPPTAAASAENATASAAAAAASQAAAAASAASASADAATATSAATSANNSNVSALAAKTAAEAANTAAQAAKTAAEAARDAAALSAAAASTSETNANSAKIAAQSAQTAAVAAKVAAEAAQTAAAASQIAAASSETNATTQAAAALVSANAAAASAAAAALAVANQYLGGAAGNAVPATATTAGQYYRITSAGTSQSKTWAAGDMAIYNGTSGSWTQIAGILPYATTAQALADVDTGNAMNAARVAERINKGVQIRAPRETLFADGGTAGARIYWPLGSAGDGIGASGYPRTIIYRYRMPEDSVAAARGLGGIGASNATLVAGTWGFNHHIFADNLYFQIYDSTGTNTRYYNFLNGRLNYSGNWVTVSVDWDGTNGPTVYINGIALSSPTETTGGTPPAWSAAIDDDYAVQGIRGSTDRTPGFSLPLIVINARLTAAETLEFAQTGLLPSWCEAGTGSMLPGYTSNFSAGADSWGQNISDANLVVTGNADAVSAVDDTLNVLASGAAKVMQVARSGISAFLIGRRYRLKFDYFAETGALVSGSTYFGTGASTARWDSAGVQVVEGSWQTGKTIDFTFASGSQNQFRLAWFTTLGGGAVTSLASGKNLWIKNVTLQPLGPLFKGVIQPIPVIDDQGENGIIGVITSGISPITSKRDWVIRALTSTSGNQQILGASVFFNFLKVIITNWWINNGGTSKTVSLGNVSAGTQYQSLGTFAAGRVKATLATEIPATNNLWVNSNGIDNLQHTIRGHMVD